MAGGERVTGWGMVLPGCIRTKSERNKGKLLLCVVESANHICLLFQHWSFARVPVAKRLA